MITNLKKGGGKSIEKWVYCNGQGATAIYDIENNTYRKQTSGNYEDSFIKITAGGTCTLLAKQDITYTFLTRDSSSGAGGMKVWQKLASGQSVSQSGSDHIIIRY